MSIFDVETGKALKGLKVLDLGQSATILLVTRYLADHGATVIWLESRTHPDITRVIGPFVGGKVDANRSAMTAMSGASKFSVGVNIRHPEGVAVVRRLAAWADLITYSYPPGVLENRGLGHEDLRKINPKAIIVGCSSLGNNGPYKDFSGWGWAQEAIAGLAEMIGWPDRPGVMVPINYPDFSTPWLFTSVVLGALEYRRRTGKGQYIELSQLEGFLNFVPSHLLLQYTANKEVATRAGNQSNSAVPHAAYPCKGEDRWCVISVKSDDEWRALCKAMGDPAWTKKAKFAAFLGRKRNEAELDALVADWTVNFTPGELGKLLQGAGVAAGPVATYDEILVDPQLKRRGMFFKLSRPGLENVTYWAFPGRMSATPAVTRPAPKIGQDTEAVCKEVLGMSDEEFVKLLVEDTLEVDTA